jgi:hypothetical protein
VNTPFSDRSDYARLAYVPLGLFVLTAFMRASVAGDGPSSSLLSVDLLALAMGALLCWLGGEFGAPREAPIARRRLPRERHRAQFAHKTV